jgi:hypothetical protein
MLINYLESSGNRVDHLYKETSDSVVLTYIHSTDETEDMQRKYDVLGSINNIPVTSLAHLTEIVESERKKNKYLLLQFKTTPDVHVIESSKIDELNKQIAEELNMTKLYEISNQTEFS